MTGIQKKKKDLFSIVQRCKIVFLQRQRNGKGNLNNKTTKKRRANKDFCLQEANEAGSCKYQLRKLE